MAPRIFSSATQGKEIVDSCRDLGTRSDLSASKTISYKGPK